MVPFRAYVVVREAVGSKDDAKEALAAAQKALKAIEQLERKVDKMKEDTTTPVEVLERLFKFLWVKRSLIKNNIK